jgi:hypothetical protein
VVVDQRAHAQQPVAAQRERHVDLRAAGVVLGIEQGTERGGISVESHAA